MSPLKFLRVLWLFTESDFATFVVPDTAFGFFGALAGSAISSSNTHDLYSCLRRLPLVLMSNWLNLLIFDLANQVAPESITEDTINKPWRPLPAGLVTPRQTQYLLLASVPLVLISNYILGAGYEAAVLVALTWMYNGLGGGNDHFVVRNLIICVAFGYYNEGSLRVALGQPDAPLTPAAWIWVVMISAVIFTTMQAQDMKDQAGDRTRNRSTVPLVLGDTVARWTIAVPVAVWSFACPAFWNLGPLGYLAPVGLGFSVVLRILWLRSVEADRRTWQMWTAWTAVLYALPAIKRYCHVCI